MRAFFSGLWPDAAAASLPKTFWSASSPCARSSSRSTTKRARRSWPASAMRRSRVDRDPRLAGAGGEAEKHPLVAPADLLERGADRRVLVVPPARLAAAVGPEERLRQLVVQRQADGVLPQRLQLARRGELHHRTCGARDARAAVEEDPQVPVGRDHERHVEPLAGEVALRLVEPVRRVLVLALRLEHRHRHRLVARVRPHAQRVVRAPDRAPPGPPVHDLDRPERLLAPDQVLGPPASVEGRVDQLLARLRLIEERPSLGHGVNSTRADVAARPVLPRS